MKAFAVILVLSIPQFAFSYQQGTYECSGSSSNAVVKVSSVQILPGVEHPYLELSASVRGNLRRISGFAQVYVRKIQKKDVNGKPVRNEKNEMLYVDEEVIRLDIPPELERDIPNEILHFDADGNSKGCKLQQ